MEIHTNPVEVSFVFILWVGMVFQALLLRRAWRDRAFFRARMRTTDRIERMFYVDSLRVAERYLFKAIRHIILKTLALIVGFWSIILPDPQSTQIAVYRILVIAVLLGVFVVWDYDSIAEFRDRVRLAGRREKV